MRNQDKTFSSFNCSNGLNDTEIRGSHQIYSVKKVFLKIFQNSQENT